MRIASILDAVNRPEGTPADASPAAFSEAYRPIAPNRKEVNRSSPRSLSGLNAWRLVASCACCSPMHPRLVASCACCSPMLPTRFSPFSPASFSGFRHSRKLRHALAKCSSGLDAWYSVRSSGLRPCGTHLDASRLRSSRPAPAKLRFRRLESGTEGETRSLRH